MLSSYEMDVIWDALHDLESRYGVRFSFTFDKDNSNYRLECRKNTLSCCDYITYEKMCDVGLGPVWSVRRSAECMAKNVYDVNRRYSRPLSIPTTFKLRKD